MGDKDIYQKWAPIEGIPARLYCEAMHDDYEGFRILLKGESAESSVLRVAFDPALAYRNIDEGKLLKTISKIENPGSTTLYTVANSSWVDWFKAESSGILKGKEIAHYAIYTPNDCIDVLAEYEPKVEWLD